MGLEKVTRSVLQSVLNAGIPEMATGPWAAGSRVTCQSARILSMALCQPQKMGSRIEVTGFAMSPLAAMWPRA